MINAHQSLPPTEGRDAGYEQKVLIVDDDPMHLEIYGLLMKQAGYIPLPALVKFTGTDLPESESVALALLDYRLNSVKTSPGIRRRATFTLIPQLQFSSFRISGSFLPISRHT